ncbi:ABC transporter ATP-binding protein NatA [bioreactor metagenome]|uniref:ABC transporter ATP-binding protein NatA n=1 Tax=bioreactor metagenome TaxID=1076179 RepID=A0A645CL81_9ZZZZ
MLKEVGLYDFKDEKVKKYSLGMKQKLGIAQAIMEDQELLIFDEPINALDDFSVDAFRNIINKKKDEGKTILISSHNKEKLEDLFDFTVKMSNGEIVEVIKEKMNE